MRKKFAAAILTMGVGFSVLTGCASTSQLDIQGRNINLPDGRTVVCVSSIDTTNGGSGGVSCDWSNAR